MTSVCSNKPLYEKCPIISGNLTYDNVTSGNNVWNNSTKRKIIVGNPGVIKGDVSNDMIKWKTKGTELYQDLPKECKTLMKKCEPLQEIEKDRKEKQKITFNTWKKTK